MAKELIAIRGEKAGLLIKTERNKRKTDTKKKKSK